MSDACTSLHYERCIGPGRESGKYKRQAGYSPYASCYITLGHGCVIMRTYLLPRAPPPDTHTLSLSLSLCVCVYVYPYPPLSLTHTGAIFPPLFSVPLTTLPFPCQHMCVCISRCMSLKKETRHKLQDMLPPTPTPARTCRYTYRAYAVHYAHSDKPHI
jgi:hypothetical protein